MQQPHTPKFGFHSSGRSSHENSPKYELGAYFSGKDKETEEQRDRREWEKEKKRRRKAKEKKKAQEVFITMHVSRRERERRAHDRGADPPSPPKQVAAILERQQFIMKMARSFMMYVPTVQLGRSRHALC